MAEYQNLEYWQNLQKADAMTRQEKEAALAETNKQLRPGEQLVKGTYVLIPDLDDKENRTELQKEIDKLTASGIYKNVRAGKWFNSIGKESSTEGVIIVTPKEKPED